MESKFAEKRMAEIALRTYLEDVERLMNRELYDEAIAHCRHILATFPLNVDAYRLLGKALLEKNQYQDAADVFQRVLSADPSDFVSHVGLAIIREEDGVLDQAIWHMERAYELQPNNIAVLDELRRLYGKRDGREPGRIGLTRTALARLYLQGELYEQAISELESAVAEDPERVDIQVLLAETYWRDEQPAEAASRCRAILARLPNCISANTILAQIALANGDQEGARPYLEVLTALAPYQAAEIQPEAEFEEPHLERLYIQSPALEAQPHDEGPDWVRELAASFTEVQGAETAEAEKSTASAEDELPEWLREMAALLPSAPEAQGAAPPPVTEAVAEAPGPEPEAPSEPPAEPSPKPTSPLAEVLAATGPLIDAMGAPEAAPPAEEQDEETPDWLRQAIEEIPDFTEVETIGIGTTATLESWAPPTGELPDWLRQAAAEGQSEPLAAEVGQEAVSASPPDWLHIPVETEAEAGSAGQEGEEDTQTKILAPTAEVEAPSPTEAEAAAPLAWLDQLAVETEENGAEAVEPLVEMPEWLREPSPPPAAQAEETTPDWIVKALSESPAEMAAEPVAPPEAPPAEAEPGPPVEMPEVVVTETPPPTPVAAVEAEAAQPGTAEAQLALARNHFRAGNWEEAAQLYDHLIIEGLLLREVIADLEEAVSLHGTNRWYTLLGDAYSQDGQLKKAMQAYQTALKSLTTRDL